VDYSLAVIDDYLFDKIVGIRYICKRLLHSHNLSTHHAAGIACIFNTETVELLSRKYKGNIKMNPVKLNMMIWTDLNWFRVEPNL
jgi:hypothetical protein